ncbi:TetR/AcrR family transcriptional regulator [Arenibaculum pallidiluteum]|uniref:TetR/AcrR family transcriptional regulator n=1 Tax=Arenibaculum pallidiluteum TaxID=2812559 RepID=UPI001A96EDDF|nr:TetR/AcrR family transcriptional regulator [Arenibaculum pallidiluteum]
MNDRLTKTDWIRHGLRRLAQDGPEALKVVPLANALNVSRGSFYWHFRDLADFHAEVLGHWRLRSTERIIRDLETHPPGARRLHDLMRRGFDVTSGGGPQPLERAIRSWAARDESVARVVAEVDAQRIGYLADQLVASGVSASDARERALFLYWAYLGQSLVMDPDSAAMSVEGLDRIATLLER